MLDTFHLMKVLDREVLIKENAPVEDKGKKVLIVDGYIDDNDDIIVITENKKEISAKFVKEILGKKRNRR